MYPQEQQHEQQHQQKQKHQHQQQQQHFVTLFPHCSHGDRLVNPEFSQIHIAFNEIGTIYKAYMKKKFNLVASCWQPFHSSPWPWPLDDVVIGRLTQKFSYKSWNDIRTLMTWLPFQMIHNRKHKQHLHHNCLSSALDPASGELRSNLSISQKTAEAEWFGIATVADW